MEVTWRTGEPPRGKLLIFKYDGRTRLGHTDNGVIWYDHARRTTMYDGVSFDAGYWKGGNDLGPVPLFVEVEAWLEVPAA